MLKKLKLLSIFDDFIPIQSIKAHYKGHRNSRYETMCYNFKMLMIRQNLNN